MREEVRPAEDKVEHDAYQLPEEYAESAQNKRRRDRLGPGLQSSMAARGMGLEASNRSSLKRRRAARWRITTSRMRGHREQNRLRRFFWARKSRLKSPPFLQLRKGPRFIHGDQRAIGRIGPVVLFARAVLKG